MKDIVQQFFTAGERLEIERHIRAAETRSSGQIVVMAVSSSSRYPDAVLAGSGTLAMLLSLPATIATGSENMWLFLLIFATLFIVMHEVMKRTLFLKRLFVSRREMKGEVEEAAFKAFFQRRVHETTNHTGILLYISLFEHSVRVLADSGIDAKVGSPKWQEIVDMITAGIVERRPAEAICSAVDRCAEILQHHFPSQTDDRNELADAMIIGQ
jgi:putative membrane protein